MKHITNFSGGLCSFWAAWRVRERFGTENMVLLFADTLVEDGDLYLFNEAASRLLGVPITRVSSEKTPWELFREQGMIGNSLFPICSIHLKREPLDEWRAANCLSAIDELQGTLWQSDKQPATIYVGFDWTEAKRLTDLRRELPTWRIEAPMTEAPIWDKCRMEKEASALGLPIPQLYGMGFPHNNCGGRCVKAGISHWVHLYRTLPERFYEWRDEEQLTAQVLRQRGIEPFSILKDRRGGTIKPLWLTDLQRRIESGETFPRDEWGGCGCGGSTQAA
jgi:hypothetical protein